MRKNNSILGNIGLVLGSMLIVVAAFFSMIFVTMLFGKSSIITNDFLLEAIPRIVVAVALIILFKATNLEIEMGFKWKHFIKGCLLGWLLFIDSAGNLYAAINQVNWKEAMTPDVKEYIYFCLYVFGIALFEEVAVRGVVLNQMLKRWGNSKIGIYAAATVSSLIFGLWHLINLADCPWLIVTTLTQIVYAFFLGIFLAAIYLRTKNIWTVVFLHALVDFTGCFGELFDENIRQNLVDDISISSGIATVIELSIFLVLGLFYLRKVEVERGRRYVMRIK